MAFFTSFTGLGVGLKALRNKLEQEILAEEPELLAAAAKGVFLGAFMVIGILSALFAWEASQSVQWFEDESNVRRFFAVADVVMVFAVTAIMTAEVVGGLEGEGAGAVTAVSMFVGSAVAAFYSANILAGAETQQEGEYAPGANLNLVGPSCTSGSTACIA